MIEITEKKENTFYVQHVQRNYEDIIIVCLGHAFNGETFVFVMRLSKIIRPTYQLSAFKYKALSVIGTGPKCSYQCIPNIKQSYLFKTWIKPFSSCGLFLSSLHGLLGSSKFWLPGL